MRIVKRKKQRGVVKPQMEKFITFVKVVAKKIVVIEMTIQIVIIGNRLRKVSK